ncbi:MAG: orotidine-5'-phosphate decarboxylase [Dehalococcoidia bacterium]|nr:orotidine-5'-phosphate decarboxylase [Dehalococcoidia bacterium]
MTESTTSAGAGATPETFRSKYAASAQRNRSLLCVGLDPDPDLMPEGVSPRDFLFAIVEATADLVCCYKPNAAFYEPDIDGGMPLLRDLVRSIPDGVPVLLDAKRNDIGNTARFYARAVFESLGVDAVTVNPYLGGDAVEPFLEYEDRTTFVLCRTSNPGARDFQDVQHGDTRLYERVAEQANGWNTRGNVGLVVGATYPQEAARVRAICPDLPFLMPGVGAQEGELRDAVRAAADAQGGGILVNASRGVLYAGAKGGARTLGDWAAAARDAAIALRDAINDAREA